MKQQGLTIVPIGGLANRMRVVMSALKIAEEQSMPICIVWRSCQECKAKWEDLFEPLTQDNVTLTTGTFHNSIASKRNLWLPMLLRVREYDKQIENFDPRKQSLSSLCQRYSSLYLSTCYALGDYDSKQVNAVFRPLPALMEEVDILTAQFSPHTLGVHIRRKDNKEAIVHSPLSAFHQRMDSYLQEYEDAKIFLCSDEPSVKRHFEQIYKDKMITNKVQLQRDTTAGMTDAVLDLWSLSRTSLVVGSYYSSFSDTATEIGGQPLEIINVSPS